jgi:hypothetical protein
MVLREICLAGSFVLASLLVGCAYQPTISEDQWRWEKEREQQAARDAGRIGYIGNAGGTAVSN